MTPCGRALIVVCSSRNSKFRPARIKFRRKSVAHHRSTTIVVRRNANEAHRTTPINGLSFNVRCQSKAKKKIYSWFRHRPAIPCTITAISRRSLPRCHRARTSYRIATTINRRPHAPVRSRRRSSPLRQRTWAIPT